MKKGNNGNTMPLLKRVKTNRLNKKICYIHVAKCGGTSLIDAIKKQYRLRDRLFGKKLFINLNAAASLRGSEIFNENLFAYREKLFIYFLSIRANKFISGHFPFSDLAMRHYGDEWSFITILRHPVDRWFSHYFFNRYKKEDHFKTDLSLNAYLDTDDGRSLGSLYYRIFYGKRNDPDTDSEETYLKVIENINQMTCIGLVEHMDRFCRDFNQCFGVQLKVEMKNKNPLSHKDRSELITDSIRKKVEKICEPDLKIYEYVLKKIHS